MTLKRKNVGIIESNFEPCYYLLFIPKLRSFAGYYSVAEIEIQPLSLSDNAYTER